MHVDLLAELTLPGRAQAAFDLSLDAERFPPCFVGFGPIPPLRAIRLHAPPAVGSTRDVEDANGVVMLEQITALESAHRHAYRLTGFQPPLRWLAREGQADWQFESTPDGTRTTWRYRFELTSPLAWPIAAPILKVFMQGAMQRCLAAMSRQLSAGAAG